MGLFLVCPCVCICVCVSVSVCVCVCVCACVCFGVWMHLCLSACESESDTHADPPGQHPPMAILALHLLPSPGTAADTRPLPLMHMRLPQARTLGISRQNPRLGALLIPSVGLNPRTHIVLEMLLTLWGSLIMQWGCDAILGSSSAVLIGFPQGLHPSPRLSGSICQT